MLFSIYASNLFDVIKPHLPDKHAYAYDSQLYLWFKPDDLTSEQDGISAMEQCVKLLRAWVMVNKLKMNAVTEQSLITDLQLVIPLSTLPRKLET